MADNKFLTAEEVSERYRGEITWERYGTGEPCEWGLLSLRSERQSSTRCVNWMHGTKKIW
jgi:hypothetical protein